MLTLQDRLEKLKEFGIQSKPASGGRVRVYRGECAASLEDQGAEPPRVVECGVIAGDEIAEPWSGGYQMFLATPKGRKMPARAAQMRAIHEFGEDLRDGLGLPSYYNDGLGTTSAHHMYDRVEDRDSTAPKKPWEVTTELSEA